MTEGYVEHMAGGYYDGEGSDGSERVGVTARAEFESAFEKRCPVGRGRRWTR